MPTCWVHDNVVFDEVDVVAHVGFDTEDRAAAGRKCVCAGRGRRSCSRRYAHRQVSCPAILAAKNDFNT